MLGTQPVLRQSPPIRGEMLGFATRAEEKAALSRVDPIRLGIAQVVPRIEKVSHRERDVEQSDPEAGLSEVVLVCQGEAVEPDVRHPEAGA